jgi:hypothetical protein
LVAASGQSTSNQFTTPGGNTSKDKNEIVRIELTEEQKKAVHAQDASAVEFTVEELEQRIAPRRVLL